MAKLRKRGKYYYIDYSKDGRRIKKSVGTSKATAELILKDLEVKLAREETGLFLKEISVENFLKKMEIYFEKHHRINTVTRYKNILDRLRDYLEPNMKNNLSSLRPGLFEEYKIYRLGQSKKFIFKISSAKQKPISKTTINMEITLLKSMFKTAKLWEHVRENPLENIKAFKKDKKDPRFYSMEELNIILSNSKRPYSDIFSILLATGMRRDELRYLEVEDIDFEKQNISIREKPFWKPKTGERIIPIYSQILPILQRICNERHNGFLFTQESKPSAPHSKDRWYNYLSRLTMRFNLPKCGNHIFRHTFGALMIAEDMNPRKLQEIFGHANIKTTEIYSNMDKRHLLISINKNRSIGSILSQSEIERKNISQAIDNERVINIEKYEIGVSCTNRTDKLEYSCIE